MGLDELHLRVLSVSSDDESERANASKGMKTITRHFPLLILYIFSVETIEKRAPLGPRRELLAVWCLLTVDLITSAGVTPWQCCKYTIQASQHSVVYQ